MSINNIKIKKLIIHKDDRGYLFEGLRQDDHLFDGIYGQSLISVVYPNVIKGLHKHTKQTDYTLCAKGRILYVATDGKEVKKMILDGENPVLIKIPPGIWHGYKALGKEVLIVHIMDTTFDPNDTEEKDPYAFGDVWEV
ncbi:MAG: dTDP-4-dehydrorhamnose 3,5-epimerase family protein [Nanoarchaeota archaeon]|nr:dTDP-4-dehydrorhamnose 3,5-epimerase family protein [Nanoarchaeota archaeon]